MDLEEVEIRLLTEGIFLQYGYDFREYAPTSLARRVRNIVSTNSMPDISSLLRRVLHEPDFFRTFLNQMTVTTSEMFRDPDFYRAIREQVVPVLRTFPTLNVWHAGCSTGEEVYSLAILFKEEGLYDRTTFHATDINPAALRSAQEGIYPADALKKFTANYQKAGGREAFSNYYVADYGYARFDPSLKTNLVFAEHNLAIDGVFAETHLILCRNVLIYFNAPLQNRAVDLFARSLRYRGFLALGSKETVKFLDQSRYFDDFNPTERIYRRNGMVSEAR